jgi:predicted nucleic acid-binding protein
LPNIICNTSPLQYLHQLGCLHLLPALAGHVIIPQAVAEELAAGTARGIEVPVPQSLEWLTVRRPASAAVLPLVTDLGRGEAEVLALALELSDAVVILDDALARRMAEALGIRLTGTLGILLDAKRAGLIDTIMPWLDQLQVLRFRLHPATRTAVLKLAGEQV